MVHWMLSRTQQGGGRPHGFVCVGSEEKRFCGSWGAER